MEEYVRLFFTGEALQRVLACICNNSSRDIQYKISKMISSMLRTTLCIRMTPIGLAPFRNDITMVLPYSMMDRAQLDFLENVVSQASFHQPGEPIRAVGIGSEVMVISVLDSVRVWADSCGERPPLPHRYSGGKRPLGGVSWEEERAQTAREEASRSVNGVPMAGGSQWRLDTLDLLKAFVSCVFRSTSFKDTEMRSGICDIVIQMVIHEVGLTQNTVDMLRLFIEGVKSNSRGELASSC